MIQLLDKYNRIHNYLRISLTDRCNLNCVYCNPSSALHSEGKTNLLTFEQISKIVDAFTDFGINKIRLTGGEPLARKDVKNLFRMLYQIKSRKHFELAITTNGILLENALEELQANGLDRVNISLDSLNPYTFSHITGHDELVTVIKSINKCKQMKIKVKINTVVMKGVNDSELLDFVKFSVDNDINVRFIEFMPFSNNGWDKNRFISTDEMIGIITQRYPIDKQPENGSPAQDYLVEGSNATISFINSISNHFCGSCNRLRITPDGKLKACLFSKKDTSLDLKKLIDEENDRSKLHSTLNEFLMAKEFEHPGIEELINMKHNNMIQIGG